MFNWPTSTDYAKHNPRVIHAATSGTALYSVGISQDGRTQMFIGGSILTMSPDAVRQLIRQLESTLPNKDTE